MNNFRRYIGNKIRLRMAEIGLSQADFAKKMGIDASQVSRWENGKKMPEGTSQDLIAEVLHVDKETFFDIPDNSALGENRLKIIYVAETSTDSLLISAILGVINAFIKPRPDKDNRGRRAL